MQGKKQKKEEKKDRFKGLVRGVKRIFGGEEISPLPSEQGKTSKLSPDKQEELNMELLQAVKKNDIEKVKTYLKLGGDKNYKTKEVIVVKTLWFYENSTLLMIASAFGYTNIVDELIEKGVDVNIQDKIGSTALMWAAPKGHINICKLLVGYGADVNVQDKNGWTVLMETANNRYIGATKYLLSVGANPLLKTNNGETAYDKTNDEEIQQIIKTYENLWKRIGEEQTLLLIQNINPAIRDCSPDKIHSIFVSL